MAKCDICGKGAHFMSRFSRINSYDQNMMIRIK